MKDKEELKLVFTGTVLQANFLQSMLEENGIGALVRDTLHESVVAGWVSGAPDDSGLVFVTQSHEEQAKKLIEDYLREEREGAEGEQ
jgi:hypothetical protein